LTTNSDAAVATWFAPNDDKPLLQQCFLQSLPKFAELIKNQTPEREYNFRDSLFQI
jgi:hypothetical protein